jgi:PAS domain S-box-containing protein
MGGGESQRWFEGQGLADFDACWTAYELHFDAVGAAVARGVSGVAPAFADPERLDDLHAREPTLRGVVRAAIRGGDWSPVDRWLEQNGANLAALGVTLDEWIATVMLTQRCTIPHLVRDLGGDPDRLSGALAAMQDFWSRCVMVARSQYVRLRDASAKADRDALARSERLFRAIVETSAEALNLATRDGTITYASPITAVYTGRPPEAYIGTKVFDHIVPDQLVAYRKGWEACVAQPGVRQRTEFSMRAADGRLLSFETLRTNLLDDPNLGAVVSIVRDVTEHRRVEEQLRQAQKLEAVGTLAGGVAHDFNNLLSVILACSDLVLAEMSPDQPGREDVEEIRRAGERAASLTRQLLAFGRKQVLSPRPLSLPAVVDGMKSLIERLVGEHIEIVTRAGTDVGRVMADPSQIEQVVMNLVVNARDAMPNGGKLLLETSVVELAAAEATPLGLSPGAHVLLSVTDSGVGMDAATQARIFEPFFSTKRELGTGLGLATVFGIVRQSGGAITVASALGRGSTFGIYLPRIAAAGHPTPAPPPPTTLRGKETVLLVEDDDGVRYVIHQTLQRQGYRVVDASGPEEAIALSEQHEGRIHLLLTDVVMPKMKGDKLADVLTSARPDMRVLFMSGHTEDAVVHDGVLDPGVAFLGKPITPHALLSKVREVLDAPGA